jgi:GDP-D-mannose 3', 5'-epimerase
VSNRVLVTGAGGFIGHHLANYLVDKGCWVRAVDIKYPEYEQSRAHEFELLDLCRFDNCLITGRSVDEVYHLAVDMGGIGYITAFRAAIAHNSAMIKRAHAGGSPA